MFVCLFVCGGRDEEREREIERERTIRKKWLFSMDH